MDKVYEKEVSKADIVIGIPSLNEADTIGFVTQQIDKGLTACCPELSTVIINSDNNSPDDTKSAFLNTKTVHPKIYMSTGPNITRGKGHNMVNIMREAQKLNAKYIVFFDADLQSIRPDWVKRHFDALKEGYDFTISFYSRGKFDAIITKHAVRPLVAAFWGKDVHQPIAGDFAMSRKFIDDLFHKSLEKNILQFGVDIFLTSTAILGGYPIVQVYLGVKDHKPSMPKLPDMYIEVISVLFDQITEHISSWNRGDILENVPVLHKDESDKNETIEVIIDPAFISDQALKSFKEFYPATEKYFPETFTQKLKEIFLNGKSPSIPTHMWLEGLTHILSAYKKTKDKREELLGISRGLFFARHVSFMQEAGDASDDVARKLVMQQAKYFFDNKNKFFDVLK